jgi:hypothetical protein
MTRFDTRPRTDRRREGQGVGSHARRRKGEASQGGQKHRQDDGVSQQRQALVPSSEGGPGLGGGEGDDSRSGTGPAEDVGEPRVRLGVGSLVWWCPFAFFLSFFSDVTHKEGGYDTDDCLWQKKGIVDDGRTRRRLSLFCLARGSMVEEGNKEEENHQALQAF